MKNSAKILLSFGVALVVLLACILVKPGSANRLLQNNNGSVTQIQAGNYCLSCHSDSDDRLLNATAWSGGIEKIDNTPCPAIKTIHEELYYTERLLLAIDRSQGELPQSADTVSLQTRLESATQTYSRLLDTPVTSLDAFVSEAQVLRFRLGKIYSQINQMVESSKQQRILVYAGLITLILLVSLAWGWRNSQKGVLAAGSQSRFLPLNIRAWLVILLVLILFSLPIFRGATQEITEVSEEQQEQQTILDNAQRSAKTADRELARAWMLAQTAAALNEVDPTASQQAFADALAAANEAQINAFVIWGEAKSAQEAAVGEWATEEKAILIANQLDAMRSRAWGLQQIARSWMLVDPLKAEEILGQAYQIASKSLQPYRDLDLRSLAVSYAPLNADQGIDLAMQIEHPALRAWGLHRRSQP